MGTLEYNEAANVFAQVFTLDLGDIVQIVVLVFNSMGELVSHTTTEF